MVQDPFFFHDISGEQILLNHCLGRTPAGVPPRPPVSLPRCDKAKQSKGTPVGAAWREERAGHQPARKPLRN